MLNIIIPMAGKGTRLNMFNKPKVLVDIKGKPMIQVAIENITPKCEHRFIFIVRKEHCDKYNLRDFLRTHAPNCIIVETEKDTEGQVCSMLLAKKYIDNDDELLQSNSDHFVDTDINEFIKHCRTCPDGCIMTSESNSPKYSYVKVDEEGYAIETAEKKVISSDIFIIAYFRKGKDFVRAAEKMIAKNIRVNNEFYISLSINELIEEGQLITIYDIGKGNLHTFGDEEDLNSFLVSGVLK